MGASRGSGARVSWLTLSPPSRRPQSRAHQTGDVRRAQGGVPGRAPSAPRRPGTQARGGSPPPGKAPDWGTRPGTARGVLNRGDPQKTDPLSRPSASGFPICRDRAGQRGRGRALWRSPPPCSQRPRPRARGRRGRRGWGGRADTWDAPPSRGPTLRGSSGGAERPGGLEGGSAPCGDQRLPHPACAGRAMGGGGAPRARSDPPQRP